MKKLVFVMLVAFGATQAGGCIIVSDDDDPPIDVGGSFDVTWSLDPGCPVGGETAQLLIQEVDANGDPIGTGGDELYNCSDQGGATQILALGDYELTLNVISNDESTLFAQSDPEVFSILSDGDVIPVSFSFPVDVGSFGLSWTVDGLTPDDVVCNDVSAMNVEIILDQGTLDTATFPCPAGEGVTRELALGVYPLMILDLVTEAGGGLLDAPIMLTNEELSVGNVVEDLGDFDLVVP